MAEESDAHGILQITNVSTAADLTWDPKTGRVHPFVFRMCASDSVIGVLLADFARDRLAARRVAVLYEVGRTYSARLAGAFLQRFADPGAGRVTMEAHYLALETDFRPQLRLIKEFRPDVVFMPGSFPDATLMAVQARSLGLQRDLPRRRRLVEPAALPARNAARRGVLRRAVLAGAGVRPALRSR